MIISEQSKTLLSLDLLEIGALLGSGGFGTVCECFVNGKKYALKKFHKNCKIEKAVRESFDAENTVVNLRHRNIVHTFLTFKMDDSHCVLMEYVSRKNLQHIIDDTDELIDINRRNKFAKEIISGLDFAHSKSIAHLDLKPANIIITSTDECKIADFGCCQKIGDNNNCPTTPTKSNLTGTYSYRAPELLRGEAPSPKADIYSFGICLWQILVRERPYGNEHHQVIIFKVVAYNLRPEVPEDTRSCDVRYTKLMENCWQKDKTLRLSATEIIDYLSS